MTLMTWKRCVAALLMALVLAVIVQRSVRSMNVAVPSQCAFLDPDTNWFLWWWNGCGDPGAGGGGSGAGI